MSVNNSNVPSIRFPEFSGPWKTQPLSTLLQPKRKRNLSRKFGRQHVLSVAGDAGIKNQIEYLGRSYAGIDLEMYHVVDPNDVVYTKSPLKAAPYGIIKANFGPSGIVSTLYAVYTVLGSNVPKFIDYYFGLNDRLNAYLRPLVHIGAKNDMKISAERVLIDPVTYPEAEEQRKVAGFLGVVDDRIALLSRKAEAIARYKREVAHRLFARELRFRRDDGSHFPEWQHKRLKEIGTLVGGGTPDTSVDSFWDGGIVWLTPSEVKSKYLGVSARTISAKGLKQSSAKLLPPGTLLISTRASVGDVAVAEVECTTNQGFQNLIVHNDQYNEFWYYWIIRHKKKFLRWAAGSTFLEISKSEVEKIPAEVPHIDEQRRIAHFLSALDDRIAAVRAKVAAMQALKKGLQQQMFV